MKMDKIENIVPQVDILALPILPAVPFGQFANRGHMSRCLGRMLAIDFAKAAVLDFLPQLRMN